MPNLLRSLPARIGAALIAVAMGLAGLLPLFDGPGYESALAAGLLVPSVAAIVTALEVSASRPSAAEAFRRGAANGVALVGIAWLTTLAHGLRVGFCDAIGGSALFALGPGVGAILGGVWGALAGEIAAGIRAGEPAPQRSGARRRTVAVLVALAAPIGSIGVSAVRFYTSPMIFAYDPFAGFFSGSLYDTIVDPSGLITYRAASTASLLAALVAAEHLGQDGRGRLSFHHIHRPGLMLLGVASLAASFAAIVMGDRLGHWQTSETIAAELGALAQGERCEVVYPRGTPSDQAQRFVRECDAHVAAGERWLGATAEAGGKPIHIRAYLFESAAQKGALMGASHTYIAKPWRREVYVQVAGYPHPSLGHEVMHVLAGAFARGPFKVAGAAAGWLPNPGLIEGVAVAGSPKDSEDLDPREWAKTMKDLGILPPLSRLFALGFLAENSSTAYTASGAFVDYVRKAHGPETVRAWYGGAPLPALTGASWDAMEQAWHADLDRIDLPDAAKAQAKARFDRPAIFGRRCPHVVDACAQDAERMRARGDIEGAVARYQKILGLDKSPATRVAMAQAMIASDVRATREQGLAELERVAADEAIPRHVRDRASEALGDAALAAGATERAIALYKEVASRLVDEDRLRTLDVKVAAAVDERARAAVVELLIGTRGGAPDRVRAAELLGAWAAQSPSDGLASYLMARHYAGDGRFEEAADRLDRALAVHLPIQRVWVEADRLRMVVACGLGDAQTAKRMFARYTGHGALVSPRGARLDAARRLLERCGGLVDRAGAVDGADAGTDGADAGTDGAKEKGDPSK